MISNANPSGELGASSAESHLNPIVEARMEARAIREGWILPENANKSLPAKAMEWVNGNVPALQRTGMTALLAMRAHNLSLTKAPAHTEVNVQVNVSEANALREQMLNDPEYLEYARSIAKNGHTRLPGNTSR